MYILQILPQKEPKPPTTSTAAPRKQQVVKQVEVEYSLPVRLKIPKINISASIEHMGLTSEGDMQSPSKLQNVGWYKFGPHPGNTGSAVIAGHYGEDSKDTPVFNELRALSKGDFVYVEDEKGATITFVVREFRTYDKDEATPEVFSSTDGEAHLNLITCKGVWQEAQQTYSNRLVVFTSKKMQHDTLENDP